MMIHNKAVGFCFASAVACMGLQGAFVEENATFTSGAWSSLSPSTSLSTSGTGGDPVSLDVSSVQTVTINQFDGTLGTLDSVDIEVTTTAGTFSYSFSGKADSASITPTLSLADGFAGDLNGSQLGSTGNVGSGLNGNLSGSFANAQLSYSASTTSGLASFVGNGTYDLTLTSLYTLFIDKQNGNNQGTLGITSFGPAGTVVVTYNYTAVPEPETYAMMAGVALVGFGIYRRRFRA